MRMMVTALRQFYSESGRDMHFVYMISYMSLYMMPSMHSEHYHLPGVLQQSRSQDINMPENAYVIFFQRFGTFKRFQLAL